MTTNRGNLLTTVHARQRAAEAFASGLQQGDLLTAGEAEDIAEFRGVLPRALAVRGLQLQEEPDGWRVVASPFVSEANEAPGRRPGTFMAAAH